MSQLIGTIKELRRLPNSPDGNPTWAFKLEFDEGPETRMMRTGRDSSCAYLLSMNDEGRKVKVFVDGIRTVREIEFV